MSVTAIQSGLDTSVPHASATLARPGDGVSFRDRLEDARIVVPDDPAHDAARKLVAIALVQPMLAMLRETSRAEGPFAPGDAEKRFGPLLDQQIAERITKRAHFALVDRIAEQLQTTGSRSAASAASHQQGRLP